MTTPSTFGSVSSHYPAHSNPNLQQFPTRKPILDGLLARSSSQPPDVFCWDESSIHSEISEIKPFKMIRTVEDANTQTDEFNTQYIEEYVLKNPRHILELLGLAPESFVTTLPAKIDEEDEEEEEDDEDELKELLIKSPPAPENTKISPTQISNSFTNNVKRNKSDVELGLSEASWISKHENMWQTNHVPSHRYSAGDAEKSTLLYKTENSLPSTHSMKFYPSEKS